MTLNASPSCVFLHFDLFFAARENAQKHGHFSELWRGHEFRVTLSAVSRLV